MFNWLMGGDAKPEAVEAPASGFHPIVIPPSVPTPAAAGPSPPPPPLANAAADSAAVPPRPPTVFAEQEAAAASPLFGGMHVSHPHRRHRRRRTAAPIDGGALGEAMHETESTCSGGGDSTSPQQPPATRGGDAALRQRLTRFYRHHNPTKLAQVDAIADAYSGREAVLFDELTARYGPEPIVAQAAASPATSLRESNTPRSHSLSVAQCGDLPPHTPAPPSPSPSSGPPPPEEETANSGKTHTTSPSPSDSTAETMEERHRRELRVSQDALVAARAAVASVLRGAQDTLQQRQGCVRRLRQLEDAVQACAQAENYAMADTLSGEVAHVASQVRAADAVWAGVGDRLAVAQSSLERAAADLASLLRAHEAEMCVAEDAAQARVESQLRDDDSDLQQREDAAAARAGALLAARVAAQDRLHASEESQSRVRQRVAEATRSAEAEQESLARDVDALNERIAELRAELRAAEEAREEKRMRLSALGQALETTARAHAADVEATAAAVAADARAVALIEQEQAELESERRAVQQVREERRAAADAVLMVLREQQQQRAAAQERMIALEQVTLPESQRYWRGWSSLVVQRLGGAGVLFDIPAAVVVEDGSVGGSLGAIARCRDLERQLREAAGEVRASAELSQDAQQRLDESRSRVPALAASKLTAVANKNFKEAQQCADALKALQRRMEQYEADVERHSEQVRALERGQQRLRRDLAEAEAETQRCAADFMKAYRAAITSFEADVARVPDYLRLPQHAGGDDELAAAALDLWAALRDEFRSAAVPAAPVPVASPPVAAPAASVEGRLRSLEMRLEAAVSAEAYDECEAIQQEIEALQPSHTTASPQ